MVAGTACIDGDRRRRSKRRASSDTVPPAGQLRAGGVLDGRQAAVHDQLPAAHAADVLSRRRPEPQSRDHVPAVRPREGVGRPDERHAPDADSGSQRGLPVHALLEPAAEVRTGVRLRGSVRDEAGRVRAHVEPRLRPGSVRRSAEDAVGRQSPVRGDRLVRRRLSRVRDGYVARAGCGDELRHVARDPDGEGGLRAACPSGRRPRRRWRRTAARSTCRPDAPSWLWMP